MTSKNQRSQLVKKIWIIKIKGKYKEILLSGAVFNIKAMVQSLSRVIRRNVCTPEPDFYIKFYEIDIEGQKMETYQIFVVPMGNTKIH